MHTPHLVYLVDFIFVKINPLYRRCYLVPKHLVLPPFSRDQDGKIFSSPATKPDIGFEVDFLLKKYPDLRFQELSFEGSFVTGGFRVLDFLGVAVWSTWRNVLVAFLDVR